MTIKTDEQATTLAWHKGAFAGKNVWYDDDPYYIYYPADQYEDDLRNGVGSDVADLILNVKDALVKNGAWDITGAERTFYDQLDKMNDDGYSNDIDRAKGTKTSAEVKAEASKFIQQYLGVELEDKNVRSQLFPNTSSACLCSISCCGFSHDDFSGLGRACRPRNGLNWMVLVSPPERTGKDYDQHAPSTVYPSFAAERGIRRVDRAENTCQRADGA